MPESGKHIIPVSSRQVATIGGVSIAGIVAIFSFFLSTIQDCNERFDRKVETINIELIDLRRHRDQDEQLWEVSTKGEIDLKSRIKELSDKVDTMQSDVMELKILMMKGAHTSSGLIPLAHGEMQ